MRAAKIVFFVLSMWLGFSQSAWATSFRPDCSTPVSATKTLLKNLLQDNWHRTMAATCIGGDEKAALQLKQVLDAQGIYIDYSLLPNDADYTNDEGMTSVPLSSRLPNIKWEKQPNGEWQLSSTSIQHIQDVYQQTFSNHVNALLDRLPATFFENILGFQIWQYLLFTIILILSWLVGRIVDRVIYAQILRYVETHDVALQPEQLLPLRGPIVWLSISVCFLAGIPDLQLPIRSSQGLFFISRLILSISAVLLFSRIIDFLSDVFLTRAERTDSKLDDQLIPLVKRAGKTLVWLFGVVFILQNMGVQVTALVAFGSVGGVAIALASKDTVENLFGSLVVFIDQPFQIGEYVVIDGSIEGVIEEVGFRSTRIRTLDRTLISVPNAKISQCTVNNFAKISQRRFKCTVTLRYDTTRDNLQKFINQSEEFLKGHEQIDETTVLVLFNNMNSCSLDILVMAFINSDQWMDLQLVKQDIFFAFMKIAEDLGVGFAFPTTTIEFENQSPSAQ